MEVALNDGHVRRSVASGMAAGLGWHATCPGIAHPPEARDHRRVYELLVEGLGLLATRMDQSKLFLGPTDVQMRAQDIGIDELSVVSDLKTANRALHLIVVQGEGAGEGSETSHYTRFRQVRDEFRGLRDARPSFVPSRPVARNPVMRRLVAEGRVHITGAAARPVLDCANAVYSLMVRCLIAVSDISGVDEERRKALLACATGLMKAMAELASHLTTLPANDSGSAVTAGITFAMLRSTEGLAPGVEPAIILGGRLEHIIEQLPRLGLAVQVTAQLAAALEALLVRLKSI